MKIKSLSLCLVVSCIPSLTTPTSQPIVSPKKAPVEKNIPKQPMQKNNKKLQSPWNQVAQAIMNDDTKQAINLIYTHQKQINFNQGNSINNTLLMLAVYHKNSTLIEFLLNLKKKNNQPVVNVNKANKFGNTPLMIAAAQGNIELVQILLDHNANKSLKNKYGKTALDYAHSLNNKKLGTPHTPNKQQIINLLKPQEESFLEKIENLL